MSTKIEYNGSVVATVEGGNTATLPVKDKKMKSDIVVSVPSGSGGGLDINGVIEQYKVNEGATVNAGDFVEFVQRWVKDSLTNETPTILKAVNLTNDTVAVFYIATNAIRAAVAVLGESGATVTFDDDVYSTTKEFTALDADAINDTDVAVGYTATIATIAEDGSETITYESRCFVTRFSNSYSNATIGTRWGYGVEGSAVRVIYLNNTYILFCYCKPYDKTITYWYYACFQYDNETLEFASSGISGGSIRCYIGNEQWRYFDVLKLDSTHVAIAYVDSINGSSLAIITLGSTALSLSSRYVSGFQYANGDKIKIVKKSDSTFYLISNDIYKLSYANNVFTTDHLSSNFGTSGLLDAFILDNRLICLYESASLNYIRTRSIYDFTTINASVQITPFIAGNFLKQTNSNSFVGAFSITKLAAGGLASAGVYASSFSMDDLGVITENNGGNGIFVQPSTSRLHNVGVAKTSGAAGETVDVYCASEA